MNDRIRRKLISLVRLDDSTISIPTLNQQSSLGLNMENNHEKNMLHEILNEISEREHEAGRPLLSSLVKIKPKGQGDNFYKMCEKLGYGNWRELKKDPNFLENQIENCRDFWNKEENYKQYLDS
jgi:hypothetical protein